MIVLAFSLAALAAAVTPVTPAVTVIVGATLVDGGGRAPLADSIVVIRGTTIAAVGDRMRTPIPKGATLVDGRRLWLAPAAGGEVAAAALPPAIAVILRGADPRVAAGQPAHLALLDGDPRGEGGAKAAVRRRWIAGAAAETAPGAAR